MTASRMVNNLTLALVMPALLVIMSLAGCQGKKNDTFVFDSSWQTFAASSQGGSFSDDTGGVTLTVPPGALATDTTLGTRPAVNPPLDAACIPNTAYEFGPHGITFEQPVQMVLKYRRDEIPQGMSEENLKIVHLVDGSWIPILDSVVNPADETITGAISSFSTYTVKAWLKEYDPSWPLALQGRHSFGLYEPKAYSIGLPPSAYCPVLPGGRVTFWDIFVHDDGSEVTTDYPWHATFWWYLKGDIGIIGTLPSDIPYEVGEETWLPSTEAAYFKAHSSAENHQTGTITVRIESYGEIIGEYSTHIEILTDVEIIPNNISCGPDDEIEFECRFPLDASVDFDQIRFELATTGKYGFLIDWDGNPQTKITDRSFDAYGKYLTYKADADADDGGSDEVSVEVFFDDTVLRKSYAVGKATAVVKIARKTLYWWWLCGTPDGQEPVTLEAWGGLFLERLVNGERPTVGGQMHEFRAAIGDELHITVLLWGHEGSNEWTMGPVWLYQPDSGWKMKLTDGDTGVYSGPDDTYEYVFDEVYIIPDFG